MTLLARLEAATGPDRELDAEIGIAAKRFVRTHDGPRGYVLARIDADGLIVDLPGSGGPLALVPRYTASIDAALSWMPEGWRWQMRQDPSQYCGILHKERVTDPIHRGFAPTPALALCIAIARARGIE
jgi:hypothetical protein